MIAILIAAILLSSSTAPQSLTVDQMLQQKQQQKQQFREQQDQRIAAYMAKREPFAAKKQEVLERRYRTKIGLPMGVARNPVENIEEMADRIFLLERQVKELQQR